MSIKSYICISKPILVLILYMLFSFIFKPILCQNKKIAVISNVVDKGKINRNDIEQITKPLIQEDDLAVVLILVSYLRIQLNI